MKILYLTISFFEGEGTLYQDLVNALTEHGHEVTIVRSTPFEQETKLIKRTEYLSILNVRTPNPFEQNVFKKALNQISLSAFFKFAIVKFLSDRKFDVILYATPPVTLEKLILFLKKKYIAKTFLMLKDIFPQNAVDLNFFSKNSLIYKYYRMKEKKYYEISDFIGCMSHGNREYLLKHNRNIDKDKVLIFPNSISIKKLPEVLTRKYEEKVIFIFGGNLGKPQGIPFLLDVIEHLRDYNKAEFLIVGDGTESRKIEERIEKSSLGNLRYSRNLPREEYERVLMEADVGLICLDSHFTIPNIPSRFQAYLKLSKPVLAITDRNTDIRDMIIDNECGWWVASDDLLSTTRLIKKICENREDLVVKSRNCQKYLCRDFDVEGNVRILEDVLK